MSPLWNVFKRIVREKKFIAIVKWNLLSNKKTIQMENGFFLAICEAVKAGTLIFLNAFKAESPRLHCSSRAARLLGNFSRRFALFVRKESYT